MTSSRRVAVIPALNEEKTLAAVVDAAKKHVDEVIVVDDASSDRTASVAREKGATVISHAIRGGYDKTIGDGFELAVANKADIVLTLDADGQHLPSDIPRLVQPIEKGEADIVVGRRTRHARISETLFAGIAKAVLGIEDPLCGFKAYDVRVYRAIGHFDTVSSVGTQLLFSAKRKGYRLVQVDIGLKTRGDIPRFGGRIVANYRILKALARILVLMVKK
jgi:glycosyltransferase involved in cell wall biosynthesis